MPTYPPEIRIVEVGPRDGLQNESVHVPTAAKIEFINALAGAGLINIEAGSLVHPKLVPQLADSDEVLRALPQSGPTVFSALVPNEKGLERAIAAGVKRVAIFTAASESFTEKNIGMTIAGSIDVFRSVVEKARAAKISVRAYLSTAFVCPYEGRIDPQKTKSVANQLLDLGVDEVAISDTVGAAVPTDVFRTIGKVMEVVPLQKIAVHLHDTYGTALANALAAMELGIATFDSSAGGLGGCPFAPGAAGNLATEDLAYMLDGMGIRTGVNAARVTEAADTIASMLGRPLSSAGWRRLRAVAACQRST